MGATLQYYATRVARPKDKGAVENEVKIAYQRIYAPLRDEIFYYPAQLSEAVNLINSLPYIMKNSG